jgi:hypothetical protein
LWTEINTDVLYVSSNYQLKFPEYAAERGLEELQNARIIGRLKCHFQHFADSVSRPIGYTFRELKCRGLLQLLTINKCYRNVVGLNVIWKVALFCLMIPAFQNKKSIRVSYLHITNKIERIGEKFI